MRRFHTTSFLRSTEFLKLNSLLQIIVSNSVKVVILLRLKGAEGDEPANKIDVSGTYCFGKETNQNPSTRID